MQRDNRGPQHTPLLRVLGWGNRGPQHTPLLRVLGWGNRGPQHTPSLRVWVGRLSVNRAQHAAPACSRGYLNQGTQDANKAAPEGSVAVFLFGTLNGPVNHHG